LTRTLDILGGVIFGAGMAGWGITAIVVARRA